VMFPKGSPELVEPIYKNPLLSAPFNEQLAAAIRAYALHMLQVSSEAHEKRELPSEDIIPCTLRGRENTPNLRAYEGSNSLYDRAALLGDMGLFA